MIAVIDIGSNSVRLMLWADGKTILKRLFTTRLGAGIGDRRLMKPSMERSAEAVSCLYREAKRAGAEQIYAFATAAVRSAENRGDFLKLVKEATGLTVDVVSGFDEAMLAARGALGGGDGIVVDVGGASSEVVCIKEGKAVYANSFSCGAVTLTEASCDKEQNAESRVNEIFAPLPALGGRAYAVGGTATRLACLKLGLKEYDAKAVQNCFIAKDDLAAIEKKLFSMSVSERKLMKGMDENRADVIACGACILLKIVERLSSDGIFVSDRDNLEGYLYVRGIV